MSADKILSRLQGVRSTGAHKWNARCPAHEDGSPSLAIRELDDGRVLIHCFASCESPDVLAALGLTFTDLFPESLGDFKPERRPFDAMQVLIALTHELLVCDLILCDIEKSRRVTVEHRERLHVAAVRVGKAINAAGEQPVSEELRRIRAAA